MNAPYIPNVRGGLYHGNNDVSDKGEARWYFALGNAGHPRGRLPITQLNAAIRVNMIFGMKLNDIGYAKPYDPKIEDWEV